MSLNHLNRGRDAGQEDEACQELGHLGVGKSWMLVPGGAKSECPPRGLSPQCLIKKRGGGCTGVSSSEYIVKTFLYTSSLTRDICCYSAFTKLPFCDIFLILYMYTHAPVYCSCSNSWLQFLSVLKLFLIFQWIYLC